MYYYRRRYGCLFLEGKLKMENQRSQFQIAKNNSDEEKSGIRNTAQHAFRSIDATLFEQHLRWNQYNSRGEVDTISIFFIDVVVKPRGSKWVLVPF